MIEKENAYGMQCSGHQVSRRQKHVNGLDWRICMSDQHMWKHVYLKLMKLNLLFLSWQCSKTKPYFTATAEVHHLNPFPACLSLIQNLMVLRKTILALVNQIVMSVREISDEKVLLRLILCECEYNWFQFIEQLS